MKYTNSITREQSVGGKLQIRATLVMLGIAMVLPFLTHLLPAFNGTPAGAILLPMFYAPFIAVALFRVHVGLIAAIAAPLLNYAITGNPASGVLMVLSIELVLFTLIAWQLLKLNNVIAWIAAPISYLLAKGLSGTFLAFVPELVPNVDAASFVINSIQHALPGLAVLLAINVIIKRLAK